jgi:hypothetical protein
MNTPAGVTEEPLGDVEVTTSDVERVERALIDASTRLPVLVFYTSAVAWLLLATLLGVVTSLQMHAPDLLSGPGSSPGEDCDQRILTPSSTAGLPWPGWEPRPG